MANIGFLKRNDAGNFVGKIDTLAFSNVVGLRRVISDNPRAPKFEMLALTGAQSWVKIGGLFEQSIKSSGESFYQGRIDDPSMMRPMDIALFASEEGGFNIAWTRRRARQELPAGEPELPPMDDAQADKPVDKSNDGLGDSTAPDAPDTAKGAAPGKGKGEAAKAGEAADKVPA